MIGLGLVAAACRDPNPYFDEPPFPTTTAASSTGYEPPTSTDVLPTDGVTGDTGTTVGGGSLSASASDVGETTFETTATTGALCMAGETVCDGLDAKICDGMGGYLSSEGCGALCVSGIGCADCVPGTGQCVGDFAQSCGDDGLWIDEQDCDPAQGLTCDPDAGACDGACASAALGTSHLGCDFYAVTLASYHPQDPPWFGSFAAVIVNPGGEIANITVTQGDLLVLMGPVYGGTAATITLDYVDPLVIPDGADTGPSALVSGAAYRIRSDQPVAVFQFDPINAQTTGEASLLYPVHTWTGDYVVASRAHFVSANDDSLPGFYTVVASEDATTVAVTPSPTVGAVQAGGGIDDAGDGVVVLDAGDVLQVLSSDLGNPGGSDHTGTFVSADKPIAVFGGHKCGEAPTDTFYCNHLEESMPPIASLGTDYVLAAPHGPNLEVLPTVTRVIAVFDDTELVYEPDDLPLATNLAKAGDFLEIDGYTIDRVTADAPILVVQYIGGVNQVGAKTAQAVAVPLAQFRDSYRVYASLGYGSASATLIAATGTTVTRDGVPVEGWTEIGATGHSVARVTLAGSDDGSYEYLGDAPFGVSVYGYDNGVSYWIPGGQELAVQ